jgi:phosphohistidine phosphatase
MGHGFRIKNGSRSGERFFRTRNVERDCGLGDEYAEESCVLCEAHDIRQGINYYMELYILRHGIAEEKSVKWPDDSKRPLTTKGEKRMCQAAAGIKAMGLAFDLVLTSPFERAKRTAEIVVEILGGKIEISTHLESGADRKKLVQQLNGEYQGRKNILLVGHEPDLSEFISLLCCGNEDLQLTLKKGGLCKLSIAKLQPGKCASMEWLLTPKQLRMAGK